MLRWNRFRWNQNNGAVLAPAWGKDTPQTADEYLDLHYWMRDIGGVYEGSGTDSSASGTITLPDTIGGENVETALTPSRTTPFTIEIRHPATWVLIASISNWFKGALTEQVEIASELSFTVYADNAAADYLVRPNVVIPRDRWGMLIGIFEIQKTKKRRDGDFTFLDVVASGAEVQLLREYITSYSTGYTFSTAAQLGVTLPDGEVDHLFAVPVEKSILTILAELLALQVQTPMIGIGRISPAIALYETAFSCDHTNLFAAIRQLQSILPKNLSGHWYIDSKRRLNWQAKVGKVGQTIQDGQCVKGLNYEASWDDLVTRLYAYGQGQDMNSRVNLTDYGSSQANEYIDSDNQGTYGIVPGVWIDNRIKYASTLLKAAQRVLEERKTPLVTADANLLDLAQSDTAAFAAIDDIAIGSDYRLVDSDLSIDTTLKVKKITRDLTRPLNTQAELGSSVKSLADIIDDLLNGLNPPVDVNDDGESYPTIARRFVGTERTEGDSYIEGLAYRGGDLRYTEDGLAYYDAATGAWVELATADGVTGGGTAVRLCRITGGVAGSWTIQEVAANGDLVGTSHSSVTVATGHEDAFEIGNYVSAAFCVASSGSTTVTPKILNAFKVAAT